MGGRHGPHPISSGDELLEILIDEVRGLREDLARDRVPADPGPSAPEPEGSNVEPVEVQIKEPARPAKRTRAVKVTEPAAPSTPTDSTSSKES